MTAEEAAETLGVSVTTIYAYVSRKLIRAHRDPGRRVSHYWRADVERIRKRGANAGRDESALVSQTQITLITESGPFYRGRSAIELSETSTLEAVAAGLWQADLSTTFPDSAPACPPSVSRLWPHLEDLTATDRATAIFPLLERETPRAFDLSPAGFARTGAEAMRWFAAVMIGAHAPTAEPLHKVIVRNAADVPAMEDVVRRLLVLSADHELDPTTFAVRAAANTGLTPYRIILAGLMASSGRRLTYGRVEALTRLVEDIVTAPDARDIMIRRLMEGETLPGFGSRLYAGVGDPRAASLLVALNANLPDDRDLQRLNAAIEIVYEATGQRPELALLNLFIGRKLRFTRQYGVTLRLGRIAGWVAHAMEQHHGRDLVRPRAIYTGLLPNDPDIKPLALG